jgi:hypothetical protein
MLITATTRKSMSSPLSQEFEFYLANQDKIVSEHNNKYVVIKDRRIIGVFDDELTAINQTKANHELGTFLVQKVEPGNKAYTQTFHSRVLFS